MARRLLNALRRLTNSFSARSGRPGKNHRRSRRLACEPLEQRQLLTIFTVPGGYAAIQSAINAAAAVDPSADLDPNAYHTIQVDGTTYNAANPHENVNIYPNAYLRGLQLVAADAVRPLVDPASGIGLNIQESGIDANNPIAVQGFDFDPAGNANGDYPVQIISGSNYVTFDNNLVNTVGGANQGISLTGPYNGLSITNNVFTFDDTGGDVALNFNPESTDAVASNVTVTGNTFDAAVGTSVHNAMKFGSVSNLLVQGNTLESLVRLHVGAGGTASDNVTIQNNTFQNTDGSALTASRTGVLVLPDDLGGGTATGAMDGWTIQNNGWLGVRIGVVSAGVAPASHGTMTFGGASGGVSITTAGGNVSVDTDFAISSNPLTIATNGGTIRLYADDMALDAVAGTSINAGTGNVAIGPLTAGQHRLRLEQLGGSMNLDQILWLPLR